MSDNNLDQTFLSGSNSVFINDLLNKWENDPKSVPEAVSYTHLRAHETG